MLTGIDTLKQKNTSKTFIIRQFTG